MPVNRKSAPLRPLPMRITPNQFARLQAQRDYDAIAVQEHVRRALDLYLDLMDKRRAKENPPTPAAEPDEPDPVVASPPAAFIPRGDRTPAKVRNR
jgi:hypothetical protein